MQKQESAGPQELEYLASLFGDPDEVVAGCVDKRIMQLGPSVIPELEKMRQREDSLEIKRILSSKILGYNAAFRVEDLKRLSAGRTAVPFTIHEGAFLISSMLNPQIRRDKFEDAFFQCSMEIHNELSDQRTAIENVGLFNHIFYHRLRFTICDQQVTTEKNAMIYEALCSRRGNPFAISLIYMMLAEDAGLPLYPLCFPGGFVPAYVEKSREMFYINIFQNGEVFQENKLKDYMIEQGMSVDHTRFLIRRPTVLLNIYLESLAYLYGNLEAGTSLDIVQKALATLGDERFLAADERQEG